MSQRARFWVALLPAVLGICVGAADIAFAGTNAKGCTTKLFHAYPVQYGDHYR